MTNSTNPRDEADLDSFLKRESPVSAAYDGLELVEPPEFLDAKVLAMAKGAGGAGTAKSPPAADQPATSKTPAAPLPATPAPAAPLPAGRPPPIRASRAAAEADDDQPPGQRPRWLVPAALAASVLVAVGVGVNMVGFGTSEPGTDSTSPLGSLFAKRARERSESEKAAAEAAAAAASREAELELAPLPPPPVFEAEGPQVQELDTAIALIRKELVLANQMASIADEAQASEPAADARAAKAAPAGASTLVPDPAALASAGVVQPRNRRLTKILELYDGGNPDLAAASLEIFLRDFEDDPISQRILDSQPKVTDVAVE